MKKLFITLCLILLASTCHAAAWVDVTNGEFGAMGIDTDSILHYECKAGLCTAGKYGWESVDKTMGIVRLVYIIDETLEYNIVKEWEYKNGVLIATRTPPAKLQKMKRGTDGEKIIKTIVNWNTGAEPKQ